MSAYYLAASLPTLTLGEPPPWSPESFLFHCQGALDSNDWQELALIVEDRASEGASDFAAWWTGLDTQIRNTQARLRAARLNVDARPYQRMHSGFEVWVNQAIIDAMSRSQPMEREMAIDRVRWAALDERVAQDRFGLDVVLAYSIRLRMVGRWHALSADAGMKRIETFITENVDESLELQRFGGA